MAHFTGAIYLQGGPLPVIKSRAGDASGFSGMTMRVAPERGSRDPGHPGRGERAT